jgi:hypothetical protein
MKLLRYLALVALGTLTSGLVTAGDLVIGHVAVRLGMDQQQALAALRKEFDVRQVSVSEGKFLLWTREPETQASYSAGSVSFRAGKLYRASKIWGEGGVKNRDPLDGFFRVLAESAGKAGKACTITAETLRGPAGENSLDVRLVNIELAPDRKIQIRIFDSHGPGYAPPEVDEWLVEPAAGIR